MGVDYSGNYGIGVKVVLDADAEDVGGWLDDKIMEIMESSPEIELEWFQVGAGNYTGKANDYYVCINDPFAGGCESLAKKVDVFKDLLFEYGINYEGEVDCVGGLYVW